MRELSNTYYFRKRIYIDTCNTCEGTGLRKEKVYHNRFVDVTCYACQGTCKKQFIETTEITDEFNAMQELLNKS
jgi:DnaJ-class molecular chaperone